MITEMVPAVAMTLRSAFHAPVIVNLLCDHPVKPEVYCAI